MIVTRTILTLGLGLSLLASSSDLGAQAPNAALPPDGPFARRNLVAWCIVPFDDRERSPKARAEMLNRLGITKLAYDYRARHVPTFEEEIVQLKQHNIELFAWWFPATLNDEAHHILSLLKKHNVRCQLWVTGGGKPTNGPAEQAARVAAECRRIRPIAEAAAKIGCQVGLYNHGGWFGEPENQLAILRELNLPNVGIVYNLHHGHHHLPKLPEILRTIRPHLLCLNLNGMDPDGDKTGKKILTIGDGKRDTDVIRAILESGYNGPIGILNHTQQDAEARLQANMIGLAQVLEKLKESRRKPQPPVPLSLPDLHDPDLARRLAAAAKTHGDATRGANVFADSRLACLSCHRVGGIGGEIGPELTTIAKTRKPHELVASVLWPSHQVEDKYRQLTVATEDGRILRGAIVRQDDKQITLVQHTANGLAEVVIPREQIEQTKSGGTVMPSRLLEQLSHDRRLDLLAFLFSLDSPESAVRPAIRSALRSGQPHTIATFEVDRKPLRPDWFPSWSEPVNQRRIYDFYAKQAAHFRSVSPLPHLVAEYPGLEGTEAGHWGTQNEETWRDGRWNETDLGTLLSGVFRGAGKVVPRAICVRLGEQGELAVCFDPETLTYPVVWKGGFVKFSDVRHGFLSGLLLDGKVVATNQGKRPDRPYRYLGLYRDGKRVVFCYEIDGTIYLDAPWVKDGQLERLVAPADRHPLKKVLQGGKPQWPHTIVTRIRLGQQRPFAIDTIELPFDNPWKALMFVGDHAFAPDGSAYLCTMTGDVWHVTGFAGQDGSLPRQATWRRFAAGLHQPLGIIADQDGIFVLGRDRITRLHDLNGDGEADWYESFSSEFETSPAGHDFICGLERDADGNFYIASGNQGIVRLDPHGKHATVLATGFRNPDGLGILDSRYVTVPCSEGTWTPASMICAVPISGRPARLDPRIGGHQPPYFGFGGPKSGRAPDLPLVYLPRGLDNSSGAQVEVSGEAWKELAGTMIHTSFGAGRLFVLLVDEVRGQPQGAIVPIAGEFRSGIHRASFHPRDRHLYVSGMDGWGTYTTDDGCFQRIRWVDRNAPLPRAFHVHQDGVLLEFTQPIDTEVAARIERHFAQCWNYRYSGAYGSPEFSPRHYGVPAHDVLTIESVTPLDGGKRLFVRIPELQPVNQLHLSLQLDDKHRSEIFLTVHALEKPFAANQTDASAKTIAAHPILTDLAMALHKKPNRWQRELKGARAVTIETGPNLTYRQTELHARAGEVLKVTLRNPDVVPHNWVLAQPGKLREVGEAATRMIASPDAYVKQYIPDSPYIIAHTDIVSPGQAFSIYFRVPREPGRYPYLCTFPGHWMVMNGVLIVEKTKRQGGDVSGEDWPMWRHDARRSGVTTARLSKPLALRWQRRLEPLTPAYRNPRLQFDRGYEPVVSEHSLVIASSNSDRVTAYDISDGQEQWRFYAEAPIRFAPVIHDGKVLFGSDDGLVYALALSDGKLLWKRRIVPSARKVLGNGRLISLWPVRGGLVADKGTVYLAAGVWPFEGIFVAALDVQTGKTRWMNDSTGQLYSPQPHNTHALSGLTPQGYLLIDGDELIVPSGGGTPARFHLATGLLKHFELPKEGRLPSGWFAAGNPARRGLPVTDATIAKDRHENGWHAPSAPQGISRQIRVGGETVAYDRLPVKVSGTVHSVIAAHGQLFVTTIEGGLYCFGQPVRQPRQYDETSTRSVNDSAGKPSVDGKHWPTLLQPVHLRYGYAVIWGVKQSESVDFVLRNSALSIIAIAGEQADVTALRRHWDDQGEYGKRVSLLEGGRPSELELPPYLASLVVLAGKSPSIIADSTERGFLVQSLRPYGGTLAIPFDPARWERLRELASSDKNLKELQLERVGSWIVLRRSGGLPGSTNYAGTWKSLDRRVRFPLGLLWFDDALSLFKRAPQPWIIDGIMISRDKKWRGWPSGDRPPYQLTDPIYTDIYTGRILSDEEVKEFRRRWSPQRELARRSDQYRPEGDTPWKPEQPVVGKRRNPLTGLEEPRHIRRFYGCDGGIDYGYLYTMRSGTGAFYDLGIESGTVHVGGIRSGCTNNLIPAGGLLNIPMMSAGCTCSYPLLSGLALVPQPESHEQWAVWGESSGPVSNMVRLGLNFGAPGDRMTRSGTLWLDYPNRGGPSPQVTVRVDGADEQPSYYYRHSVWMRGGTAWPWVAASGVEGAERIIVDGFKPGDFTVRFTFAEPDEHATVGSRVFDMTVQGKLVCDKLDVFKAAGAPMTSIIREVPCHTSDGRIEIRLKPLRGRTQLSGVELIRQE